MKIRIVYMLRVGWLYGVRINTYILSVLMTYVTSRYTLNKHCLYI